MKYREMKIVDYENIISVWHEVDGMCLREADSKNGIGIYLARNPGLSFIAVFDENIVGTIMSGHDGKRGYIQHLAVINQYRRTGVAGVLLKMCLARLKDEGIVKSHIHVLSNNKFAREYWNNRGWKRRDDIEVYSFINGGGENT